MLLLRQMPRTGAKTKHYALGVLRWLSSFIVMEVFLNLVVILAAAFFMELLHLVGLLP
jgi:hypothetical protein